MTSVPPAPTQSASLSEYHTRLWMGLVMSVAAIGVLVFDQLIYSYTRLAIHPFLFLCVMLLTFLAVTELHQLVEPFPRPPLWLLLTGCFCIAAANWLAHLGLTGSPAQPWRDLGWVFTAVILLAFLREIMIYHQPGGAIQRLALFAFTVSYLGLLPSFVIQIRWFSDSPHTPDLRGVACLAVVIFVPKGGDIGAYFTGRWLGRHRMTPLLSPKKTWEGLLGGIALSAVVAILVNRWCFPILSGDLEAGAFGAVVGTAGVLGDLAESLIKRDCRQKDASHVVPGFGGILDVVDSVLFAAPVAYWWLWLRG